MHPSRHQTRNQVDPSPAPPHPHTKPNRAQVGGLGDVVTALGRAVKDLGHNVEVLLPKYQFLNGSPILAGQMTYETEYDWGGTRIFVTTAMVENLRVFFIEPRNGFFDTQTVYGRYDDEVRAGCVPGVDLCGRGCGGAPVRQGGGAEGGGAEV
eukprot:193412-Chlamydomonas_euryale.AAC.1